MWRSLTVGLFLPPPPNPVACRQSAATAADVLPPAAAVVQVAKRYQQNPLMVDLVGSEDTGRLSDTIRLMLMQVRG